MLIIIEKVNTNLSLLTELLDDDDDVVELLPLQEWVHVARENGQVLCPVSHWNDDGDFVSGSAFTRLVPFASRHSTLNQLYLIMSFSL